jgi:4-amino-4-deoxy-L-arabinose transferase-like glycosyltransferase
VTTRQALIGAAIVGLLLRLAFGLLYWVDKPLTRDEREYLSLARSLAAGRGFVYDADVASAPQDPFGRAPGYPAFLVLAGGGRSGAPSVPTSVKAVQACVGAMGIVLVGLIAQRLAGARAAAIAAALAAVYPPLVWISAYAMSEALFWPLGLSVVWLFDRGVGNARWALVAGLAAGVAVLVRPGTLLFLMLAGVWLLGRRRFRFLAALALGSLLVITPWTIRNAAHHGRFVMVASEGGVTFWTGNHPRAIGEGDLNANPHLKREAQAMRARYPDLSEEEMEPIYYRDALAWIVGNPIDWLVLEARKVFYLLVPIGPSYWLHSARYAVASVVSYALLLPIALLGFIGLRGRRGRSPGLWCLAGSAIATCLIFFPQERFRIPILDPTMIICASGWLAERIRR